MHKVVTSAFIGVMIIILIGCGAAAKELRVKAQTERMDVFTEIKNADAPPRGFAALTIKTTIKTHLPGYYVLESRLSFLGQYRRTGEDLEGRRAE